MQYPGGTTFKNNKYFHRGMLQIRPRPHLKIHEDEDPSTTNSTVSHVNTCRQIRQLIIDMLQTLQIV